MRLFSNICEEHLFLNDDHVDGFDDFLGRYLTSLDQRLDDDATGEISNSDDYLITLIARSPESLVATAISQRADELHERGIKVKAIFASLLSTDAMSSWIAADGSLSCASKIENLRWAKNPNLLDAHEQLTLGTDMCWSGDAMRRNQERRYVMDLFENHATSATYLARQGFDAMWTASVAVSKHHIKPIVSTADTERFFDAENNTLLTELWPSHLQNTISTRH